MKKKLLAAICIVAIVMIVACCMQSSEHMLPHDVKNGEVIRCYATGKVFKVEHGKKRWYSWDAYVAAGKPRFVMKNCSSVSAIPDGPDM